MLMFKKAWSSWYGLKSEIVKLERALTILSEYLEYSVSIDLDRTVDDGRFSIKILLDRLADQYSNKYRIKDAELLAQFLFRDKSFKGNESDYYNPQNSNLFYIMKRKKGIPISR